MKAYLNERRFCKLDLILIAILIPCLVFLYLAWNGDVFSIRKSYPISQGYQARSDGGFVYVLDSGHSMLTKSLPEGDFIYRISPGLYVDGFSVGDDGCVYLNASSFGGMTVVGEQVMKIDGTGNMISLVGYNYGDKFLSKHSLHGASAKGGRLRYLQCLADRIIYHNVDLNNMVPTDVEIPYDNALDAVSDACFDGDTIYILDRNGTLFRYTADVGLVSVYNVGEAGESMCVPYRVSVSDGGEVYFTDIRSRSVQHVIIGEGRSETVVTDTDSVTVDIDGAPGQERYSLTCEGTVWLEDGRELTAFRNNSKAMALFYLAIALLVLTCIPAALLLLHIFIMFLRLKRTNIQWTMLAVVVIGVITTGLTASILINSFRSAYTEKINEELIVSSVAIANSIRAEDVLSINEAGDYGSEAYQRLSAAMKNNFDRSIDFNRNVYCNILRYDVEDRAYCIAYLDGTIGTYYPLGDYETAETIEVYGTKKPVISDEFEDISGIYLGVKVPIFNDDGGCCGVVSSGTQVILLKQLLKSMILQVLTSILLFAVMLWFVASEAIAYVRNLDVYRTGLTTRPTTFPGHSFRILLVLVFAAYNLQAAFLPSYIVHQLPEGTENAALLGSLPYTVNIFLVGLTAIFCTRLVRGMGLVKTLVLSLVLAFAGNILIFLIPGYPMMLAGMSLIGVGVGLVTNMMYVVLTYVNDSHDQVWGLSIYNAAVLAGINLGMVGGSILAVWLGQRMVFAITAGLWLFILIFSFDVIRKVSGAISIPEKTMVEKAAGGLRVLFSKRVVPYFMVCIQNPYIIFSSFAMYFLPIFCDGRGYSETTTALMLLCYAEIAILVGDAMVEKSRRFLGNGAMYAAIAIDIVGMIVYALMQNLAGMLIALLLLGLSASFGKPVQQKYFIDLPQVKRYGEDRAMGIYNFSENIGESAGPIIMAWLMFRTPLFSSVAGFCGIVAALSAVHCIVLRGGKKNRQ